MREFKYEVPKFEMRLSTVFSDELIKGVLEADSAMNRQLLTNASFKKEVAYTLEKSLNGYTKPYLYELALDHNLTLPKSIQKRELIEKLAKRIESRFEQMLPYLPKLNLEFLSRFIGRKRAITLSLEELQFRDISHAHNFGFLYLYHDKKGFKAVVPHELVEKLDLLRDKKLWERASLNQRIDAYAVSLSNLYGVLDIDQFALIWNKFEKETLTPAMAQDELFELSKAQYYWWFDDELIISSFFEKYEEVEHFLLKVREVPYYIPNRDELVEYFRNPYAQDSSAVSEMVEFLKGYEIANEDHVIDLVEEITDSCIVGNGMQDAFNLLNEYEVLLNGMEEINRFTQLYVQMNDSCRKWELRGHTPNALKKRNR
ncbi:MAG: hypothetical protein ACOXZZ_05450 [Sphaerochaetaceae bacterium]|jgi:hypothetical protein